MIPHVRGHDGPAGYRRWVVDEMQAILDWQQRGITARILGYSHQQNPLLMQSPERSDDRLQHWQQLVDAWCFGWEIEARSL